MIVLFFVVLLSLISKVQPEDAQLEDLPLSCRRNTQCTLEEIDIYNECIVDVYKNKKLPQTDILDPESPWNYEEDDVSEEDLAILFTEIPYIKCKTDKINNKICFEEFIYVKPPIDPQTGKPDYVTDKMYI